jgi:hypothetical protein
VAILAPAIAPTAASRDRHEGREPCGAEVEADRSASQKPAATVSTRPPRRRAPRAVPPARAARSPKAARAASPPVAAPRP